MRRIVVAGVAVAVGLLGMAGASARSCYTVNRPGMNSVQVCHDLPVDLEDILK